MAGCDRCDSEQRPHAINVGSTDEDKEDYRILYICDDCYCKALQFIEGHDHLEDISLEEFRNNSETGGENR